MVDQNDSTVGLGAIQELSPSKGAHTPTKHHNSRADVLLALGGTQAGEEQPTEDSIF